MKVHRRSRVRWPEEELPLVRPSDAGEIIVHRRAFLGGEPQLVTEYVPRALQRLDCRADVFRVSHVAVDCHLLRWFSERLRIRNTAGGCRGVAVRLAETRPVRPQLPNRISHGAHKQKRLAGLGKPFELRGVDRRAYHSKVAAAPAATKRACVPGSQPGARDPPEICGDCSATVILGRQGDTLRHHGCGVLGGGVAQRLGSRIWGQKRFSAPGKG